MKSRSMTRSKLLAGVVVLTLAVTACAQKHEPGNDPGNNDPPPGGAILDLGGTPIPGGGNLTYQKYTANFAATLTNTAITIAFREDPAFLYLSNVSVTDQTAGGGNLLVNGNFSGPTYTDGNNSLTPVGWQYANVYGATFGGVLLSGCGAGPTGTFGVGNCWYDGAVQAYDALTQTIVTVPGHTYQIAFWLADNSGCYIDGGPPCDFSDLSTNGDVTDTQGNGIDLTVYAGAALPAPDALHLELNKNVVAPNQGMLGLATAQTTGGAADNLQSAAQKMGFDHFNWIQMIVVDLQLQACANDTSLAGCSSDFTLAGAVPPVPTPDAPYGGYAYQYWATYCPGSTCAFTSPVRDYWPMYWDEYFSNGPPYLASPGNPLYLSKYRQGNSIANQGAIGVSPAQALGFSFSDRPGSSFIVPGTQNTKESISFVDALVGVTGSCNVLVSSNCQFQIFPGTTFKWTSTNGTVNFNAIPGSPVGRLRRAPSANHSATISAEEVEQADDFPINPVALTGNELSNSLITVDEFLSLAGLTPQSLAEMGGGISIFSGSLTPVQAAELAAALAGGTQLTSSQVSTTASGLAYSRVSQTFNGTVTIKNLGSSSINGPLQILLTGLPANVTLVNASGSLSGFPYLTIPAAGGLAPGHSVSASVEFKNPTNAAISLAPVMFSGSI